MPRKPLPPERILRAAEALGVTVTYRKDGTPRLPTGTDESLKYTALGRLFAQHHIDRHHYEAGKYLQDIAWAAWGAPFARSRDLEASGGGGERLPAPDSQHSREARRVLINIISELKHDLAHNGHWTFGSVINLCQFDREPDWFGKPALNPSEQDSRQRLRIGLETLAEIVGVKGKRRVA